MFLIVLWDSVGICIVLYVYISIVVLFVYLFIWKVYFGVLIFYREDLRIVNCIVVKGGVYCLVLDREWVFIFLCFKW